MKKLLLSLAPALLFAQADAPKPGIAAAWDEVISTAVASATPDPALAHSAPKVEPTPVVDFLNHFYFETRTNYEHNQTNFTGARQINGVINAPNTGFFNPNGIPYPDAYQPGADRIYSFTDWGTRGYGSDRVNTHFALRYRQDLSRVPQGSPNQNIIETFYGHRLFEFMDASVEINSKPTDGAFAGTSLQFGRLNVYGAEIASLDGAAFTLARPRYELTLFGGRRFSFFSDPAQRGIGGANLLLKLNPNTSVAIESLWYIRGINRVILRKRLNDRLLISSYLRSYGGALVDFDANALYSSRGGRTTLRAGFFQKLTDKDYSYDYTIDARDQDPRNPLLRLYLGAISQYSQLNLDAHQQFGRRVRLGGALALRRLNDFKNDQGPFNTSFEDYRLNAQLFPYRRIETYFEYHQRNSDRLSPANTDLLDDLHFTGETSVKDVTGELRRAFGEGRLNLSGGAYYRRISMQNAFFYINNIHQSGVLGSAWVRLDRKTRVYFDYSLDNDFFLFAPDIKNSQVFRIGLAWKY